MIRLAPWSFALFLTVGGGVGFALSNWYYAKQITEKNNQISRYRVVLGIQPGSPGALVELNNQELALRSLTIVKDLRGLKYILDKRLAFVQEQIDAGKIDEAHGVKDKMAVMQEISNDFDSGLASDANNMYNELRKRLDARAVAHVVRVPALFSADGTPIPLTALTKGTGYDTWMIGGLADEIEQMAKLLPSD